MAPLEVESVDLVLHLSVRAVQLVFARGALRFSLRTQIALVVVVSARVELLLLAHRFKVIGLMRGQPPVAQPVARVQRLCLVRLAAVLPRPLLDVMPWQAFLRTPSCQLRDLGAGRSLYSVWEARALSS